MTETPAERRAHDRSLRSPQDRFGERVRVNLSAEGFQAQIIEREKRTLEAALDEIALSGAVPRAAAIVVGARRRFVGGAGKSAAFAQLLTADLSATLSNVFLVDDRGLPPLAVLTDVRASDVLVVFSMRRYREETVRLGRLFHDAGGKLVVVTDSHHAPLAGIADAAVIVNTESASYADSPTVVAAVCHLLSTLTAASAKGARRRLALRDRYLTELALHAPEEDTDQ